MNYRTLNPATGELLEEFPFADDRAVEAALDAAQAAWRQWRTTSLGARTALLSRMAALLEAQAEDFARLMAVEMGKPLSEGVSEANKCALACRYYADHAEEFLQPRVVASDARDSRVVHESLGPILAIMPWNFPFWQLFRFAAPALAAGNVVVMKHAQSTPRCAHAIAGLFAEAGAPDGVFQSLFMTHEQVARAIADSRIAGVTLTGSTRAGREVAALAGRALKPSVMELGGSDPFIVFGDADLKAAARVGAFARLLNGGQSCIAAKRFLIEHTCLDEFLHGFLQEMQSRVMGDPLDPATTLGPMAREDLRDALAAQVERLNVAGGHILMGGKVPPGRGFYHPPTVVVGADPSAEVACEELFGPVAAVYAFDSEENAIALANATEFGLGASLWTSDESRPARLTPRLEAGSVFVNGLVKSDPRLPFGGIKASGYGRELAREGMLEFMNCKTVWMK